MRITLLRGFWVWVSVHCHNGNWQAGPLAKQKTVMNRFQIVAYMFRNVTIHITHALKYWHIPKPSILNSNTDLSKSCFLTDKASSGCSSI